MNFLISQELSENFKEGGASKDKNFSQSNNNRRRSSNKHKSVGGMSDKEEKKNPTINITFKDKIDNEKDNEKPAKQEEFKAEMTDSFANKKKLGLKVFAKKHFLTENKNEEINSSNKAENFRKKKSIETAINDHPFRNLIFSPYITESNFKRHLTITYRGLVYAKKCLKGPSETYIRAKQVNLVESKSSK